MAARLHPAHAPRSPVSFLAIDELAAHLLRQRPDRTIELTAGQASVDGGPLVPVVSAYAIRPRDRRAFQDDPAAFEADWVGVVHAGERPWSALSDALARVQTSGGIAA